MLKLNLQNFGNLMRRIDLKRPWCWEVWRQEEKGTTGWDGWMVSLTWWTWVWGSSGSWWRTGRPGVLQSTGSQGVGHNWATELNWTDTVLCSGCINIHPINSVGGFTSLHTLYSIYCLWIFSPEPVLEQPEIQKEELEEREVDVVSYKFEHCNISI